MRKYWQIYKMQLAETLTYRGAIVVYRLGNVFAIGAGIAVWLSAGAGSTLGGFTKSELVTYYVIALLLQGWTYWFPTMKMKEEIATGAINGKILTKPVSYLWEKFFCELGWHTVSPLFSIIPVLLFVFLLGNHMLLPVSAGTLVATIAAAMFGAFVCFGISYMIGLLTFWFTEVTQIASFLWLGIFIFGGQAVPVSFFPDWVRTIITILPFRSMFSFPLEIYLGKLRDLEILFGFLVQAGWLLVLYVVAVMLWRRGLRVYSAHGG